MKLHPFALAITFAAGLLNPCFALDPEWQAQNDGAEAQFKLKNYTAAEAMFMKARQIATERNENQELGKTLFDMAWMYDSLGRLSDAEILYSQLLQARIKAFGDGSVDVAKAYKLLADEQLKLNKLDKAETNMLAGLRILEVLAPHSTDANKVLIGLLKDLAKVCRLEHKDADALAYDKRASELAIAYSQNNIPHH